MTTQDKLSHFLTALQEMSVKAVSYNQILPETVALLTLIQPFPNQKFIDRLYNKAVQTSNVAVFKADLPAQPPYGPDDGMHIDGVDATDHIQLLAEQAAVQALGSLAPGSDKYGIRNSANVVS